MKFIILFFLNIFFLLTGCAFAIPVGPEDAWDPVSAGPITTWTAPVEAKGHLDVQPTVIYNRTRGEFDDQGHYVPLTKGNKESQFQEELYTAYGVTDKWEIDAQTVYQENNVTQDGLKAQAQGFGDSFLFTRYQFLDDKGWIPATTGLLQVKMPTGKYQLLDPDKLGTDFMGESTDGGSWVPGVGISLTKKFKPFLIHADLIGNFPQRVDVDGEQTRYGNYINCGAAVEYFLPKGFNLMMELNNLSQADKRVNGAMAPDSGTGSLTLGSGVGWSNDKIQMLIGYQRTLLGTNTDANDSVVATFIYTF